MHPTYLSRGHRPAILAAAFLVLLAACDGASLSSPAPLPPPAPVAKVDVRASLADAVMMVRTPSAPEGERGGTTLRVGATLVNPAGRTLPDEAANPTAWASTDERVATVDATGLVTALDTGTVTIAIEHHNGKWSDSVHILVMPVPVASVVLAGPDSIGMDDTTRFAASALDSVGEALVGRPVAWSTLAPGIASVAGSGDAGDGAEAEVIALGIGATEIGATIDGKIAGQSLTVWPQPVATVTVSPATVGVPQFHKVRFTATARDRRGKVLAGRAVSWGSSDAAVFYIKANADTAAARDLGEATVTATMEGVAGTAAVTVTEPVEARALWVTRFEYTTASAVDFAKIATIFTRAASANFNVVYFQARTSGDALYYSDLEPCSPRMCGTLGGTRPSRDPLAVAIAEGAKHGIEVHAWLNAYTGFIAGSTTACNQFVTSTPANWLKANPDWSMSTRNFTTNVITRQVDNCATTSEYMWVSPGVPQVRTQLAQVSADIARRYGPLGLRGIHLDRIRYPGNTFSYDSASLKAFRDATGAFPTSNAQGAWLNFRRGLVNQGVREVHDSVRAVNPALVLSAAVFPGYQARSGWSAAWSYSDYFQDPQAWAVGGYLDVELPMNYPATATSTSWTVKAYCSNTDWTCVMDDHIQRIERTAGRHVYVGVGAIKGWTEMKAQIDLAHDRSATGVSVYSFSQVDAIPNGWAQLAAGPFRHKATLPVMSWK